MRRSLAAAAVVLASFAFAPPARADSDRPRPLPPGSPRGLEKSGVDRPDEANTPQTGPLNRFDHGNKPVRPAALTLAGTDSVEIARSERPRPAPPSYPRGFDKGKADRPPQANTPGTGPVNRFDHGNKPVKG